MSFRGNQQAHPFATEPLARASPQRYPTLGPLAEPSRSIRGVAGDQGQAVEGRADPGVLRHGPASGFHGLLQRLVSELTVEHERELASVRSEMVNLQMRFGVEPVPPLHATPSKPVSSPFVNGLFESPKKFFGSPRKSTSAEPRHGGTLPVPTWTPLEPAAVGSVAVQRGRPYTPTRSPRPQYRIPSRGQAPISSRATSPPDFRMQTRVRSSSPLCFQQPAPVLAVPSGKNQASECSPSRWVFAAQTAPVGAPGFAISFKSDGGSLERRSNLVDSAVESYLDQSALASTSTAIGTPVVSSYPATPVKPVAPNAARHSLGVPSVVGMPVSSAPYPHTTHPGLARARGSMRSSSAPRKTAQFGSDSADNGFGYFRDSLSAERSDNVSVRDLDDEDKSSRRLSL